ncbi:LEAF RUST 10 DISEASE-RESISTANCE LOCUS RECEPTOR-LIKE PROTEIN KINASE-like 1.4 [Sesamum angolense]|uniref:LEAF RUST 10 DISEASE-RESISTANCE LOCUS RECEPTOR-LIKE PROTEIN KINASE-like 1.4 n=1 Tax=Sesamum angolense TaxID=2727404 RepID=A0AAE2C596_9LAMI|nr:LEAF RUST 10 DISEASE-RESISTANCE LOCUS RECEPTOR-LIKE PROTEIN KINASE-like 1.4 [Sesamum angolense]
MPAVDISRHRHEINLANLAVNRIQRCAFDELIDPSLGYETDAEVMRMTTSVAELAFRCLQLEKDMRPSMDEVLIFLQDIQAGEDGKFGETEVGNGSRTVPGKIPPSPETEDVVLLKNKGFQSSPIAVTDVWASSSSTATSSIG